MQLPNYAQLVIDKLSAHGFSAYAVGGCVRDSLLSLPVYDYDITTSALPSEVKAALCDFKLIETGIAHGTVTVMVEGHPVEVTTFRGEGSYSDCRHPDSVTFTASLSADLSRRDFTMNAIAYSHNEGYVDLFGGRADINARLIRAVGDADARLSEDALRILRALRFSACLEFNIESTTKAAILKNYTLLSHVSKERIFVELNRLICGKNAPALLTEFYEIFNFIFALSKERAFYESAAKTISRLESTAYRDRLAALFLDLDQNSIQAVLASLKADNKTLKHVLTLTSIPSLSDLTKIEVKKLLSQYALGELISAAGLQRAACKIDKTAAEKLGSLIGEILQNDECYCLSQLAVSGVDLAALGFNGAQIGAALNALLNEVIFERLPNEKSALLRFAQTLNK